MGTHRQEKFVEKYLETGNAAESARVAGYSARSARQIGYRLLNTPSIQAEISNRRAALRQRTLVNRQVLTNRLLKVIHESESTLEIVNAVRELGRLHGLYPNRSRQVSIDI